MRRKNRGREGERWTGYDGTGDGKGGREIERRRKGGKEIERDRGKVREEDR